MPASLKSRGQVIERLTDSFRRHGYDGASLARLSAATGLGKASLYHHFPGGKADMARSALGRVGEWFVGNVFAPLHGPGVPEERLNRMILALNEFYDGGRKSCLVELFSAAPGETGLHDPVRRTVGLWIGEFAALAEAASLPPALARSRAEDEVIRIQGALVVSRALDDREPFRRVLAELPRKLLAPAG